MADDEKKEPVPSFQPMGGIDENKNTEAVDLENMNQLNIDEKTKPDPERNRRMSVSAEANDNSNSKLVKKVYPKSKEALDRIKQSTQDVFLFEGLDQEEANLLIDAMFEKKCKKGDEIISQGGEGDYFYVIESGVYEVYKSENKDNANMDAKLVFTYNSKGAFGELALMYKQPRAATVKAVTNGVLWAVDRQTFQSIIKGSTERKRKKYENFLKQVPLLMNISDETRSSIADVLESQTFTKGQYIIEQGDEGNHFYFVQKGEAVVTLNGKKKTVRQLKPTDYFGEKACISGIARSANVIVESETIEICGMDKAAFMRLLGGPLYDKFRQVMQGVYEDDHVKGDDGNVSELDDKY